MVGGGRQRVGRETTKSRQIYMCRMVRTFWSLVAMRFCRKAAAVAATAAAANSPGRANWSPWKPPQSQSGVHSYVHLPLSRRVCNTPLSPLSLSHSVTLSLSVNMLPAPLRCSTVLSPSFPRLRTILLPLTSTILLPFTLSLLRVLL